MQAYNIEILKHSANRASPDCKGWVFGLPPGITSGQWPLDSNNGYPLQHGFTILLPDDCRVHGPEIVALSFFGTAPEHNDGGPMVIPAINAVMSEPSGTAPSDPNLLPFWQNVRTPHPRLHRLRDILDLEYAVILLTQEEFNGPLGEPPDLSENPYFGDSVVPSWLTCGSADALFKANPPIPGQPASTSYAYRVLGEVPGCDIGFNRELTWVPRRSDPNAGLGPREHYEADQTGYKPFAYEGEFADGAFEKYLGDHELGANHIGGTMLPAQNIPPFSPYYIEFDEHFGNYNFGTGNAQLDFKDIKFDWAC